jgi:O-antigen/teichoic acid export membrane protein
MLKKLTSMVSYSLLAVVATFAFQTLVTHILTTSDYGILAKWLTNLGYLSVFFVLGLDSSILYFSRLGQSFEENMGKNTLVYSFIFLLSGIIIFFFAGDKIYYLTLVTSILCFAFLSAFSSFFQYQENFKVFNVLSILRPIIIFIIFLLLFFKNDVISLEKALIYYTGGSILILIITAFYYLKKAKIIFSKDFFNYQYYLYGVKNIINKVLSLTLYASTVYCISYLSDNNVVAYFFVASSISKMVWILPDSAGNLLYPKFLKIEQDYLKEDVEKEMFYYAQVVFILNLFFLVSFFIVGKFFLGLFYNESYLVSFMPILILLIGNQGMVYYKLIGRYLSAIDKWNPIYYSLFVAIIVNVVFNFLLIPKFGLIGAAIATSLSFWSCGIFISFYVKGSLFEFINIFHLFSHWCSILLLKINKTR